MIRRNALASASAVNQCAEATFAVLCIAGIVFAVMGCCDSRKIIRDCTPDEDAQGACDADSEVNPPPILQDHQ